MTRVLQIRRGTTAQNNNFTGMRGEVTYDTEAKTLRVHDGVTLGGYALARADQTGISNQEPGTGFNINDVPGSFWKQIVETYAPAGITFESSKLAPIGNVSYLEVIFDTTAPAKFTQVLLVCQTPEAGYAIGDEVAAFGVGTRANPAPNTSVSTDGLHARLLIGGENFWVSHKTSGATTAITNTKWKAKFVVGC